MAYTVTRATLENNGILFLRDVLRENLTDPLGTRAGTAWILKSPVKNEHIDVPMVVLDQSDVDEEKVTFRGTAIRTYNLGIMAWALKLEHRDNLADEIKTIFNDDSNTDGTNTMLSQGFTIKSVKTKNTDGKIASSSELYRIKEMDFEFTYMR